VIFMKSGINKLVVTLAVLQLIITIPAAGGFDDDLFKLQQEQFKLQRQLQQQELKFQQQQLKFDRQIREQQFRTQQYLWRQESQLNSLNSYSPSFKGYVSTSPFDQMSSMRSQMQTLGFNLNSTTNSQNRELMKLQYTQFRMQPQQLRMQESYRLYPYSNLSSGRYMSMPSFDPMGNLRSQMRSWELEAKYNPTYGASNLYISRLPSNTSADALGEITTGLIGAMYGRPFGFMETQFNLINTFRTYQGTTPLSTSPASWQMASEAYNLASTLMGAAITFAQTLDRVGTSMQIMNPPIYLQNNHELGRTANFIPSQQRLLGIIPVSGTWEGSGTYSIPDGSVAYHEVLSTAGSGPITRIHSEFAQTEHGSYFRIAQTETPFAKGPSGVMEKFMLTHFPLGSYWDNNSTESYFIQGGSYIRHETYAGGVLTVNTVSNFNNNYNLSTFNNNLGFSSGMNSWIPQSQFNNNYSNYFTHTVYPDFMKINNTPPKISDINTGFPKY
jgi:hypothetical protein